MDNIKDPQFQQFMEVESHRQRLKYSKIIYNHEIHFNVDLKKTNTSQKNFFFVFSDIIFVKISASGTQHDRRLLGNLSHRQSRISS